MPDVSSSLYLSQFPDASLRDVISRVIQFLLIFIEFQNIFFLSLT